MATLDKRYTPIVLNPNSSIVGVAQVRIGAKTSVRAVGTGTVVATDTALAYVGTSIAPTTIDFVKVDNMASVAPAGTVKASGTYTGDYDGCFIVRATSSSAGVIYAPDGSSSAFTITTGALATSPAAFQGLTFTSSTLTAATAGDTWTLPVYSGKAQDNTQTGIISPYSTLTYKDSIGGLTDASWDPKLDSVAKLESGFPSTVVSQIVAKTSAGIKFTSQEYDNTRSQMLRSVVASAVNNGEIQAFAAEVVFRTNGGDLITYFCPSCTINSLPAISSKNEFSTVPWELSVNQQVGDSNTTYGSYVANCGLFNELTYLH